MNIQHLNELIRVLGNVNPINFNLEEWIVTQEDLEQAIELNDTPLSRKYQQLQDPNKTGFEATIKKLKYWRLHGATRRIQVVSARLLRTLRRKKVI